MSIHVLKAGLLDTIQDGGRFGYQYFGINPGGAMDTEAARVANMLTDNDVRSPVLELHFPGSVIQFNDDYLVAITGADFQPEIDDKPVPLNTSILVSKNSVLAFKKYKAGARAYLGIHGSWNIDKWLNSYSTNLKAKAGGYYGAALKKGDVVEITNTIWRSNGLQNTTVILPVNVSYSSLNSDNHIRYIPGCNYNDLRSQSQQDLDEAAFIISTQSDRMGYRLKAKELLSNNKEQQLSSAVVRGTIQLLPSGQLVILMADHQTTGGYPKIGQVITADFSKLAQLQPNETIRFKQVSLYDAEQALIKQHQHLEQLRNQVNMQLQKLIAT